MTHRYELKMNQPLMKLGHEMQIQNLVHLLLITHSTSSLQGSGEGYILQFFSLKHVLLIRDCNFSRLTSPVCLNIGTDQTFHYFQAGIIFFFCFSQFCLRRSCGTADLCGREGLNPSTPLSTCCKPFKGYSVTLSSPPIPAFQECQFVTVVIFYRPTWSNVGFLI